MKNSIFADVQNNVKFDLAYFSPRLTGVQRILLGLLICMEQQHILKDVQGKILYLGCAVTELGCVVTWVGCVVTGLDCAVTGLDCVVTRLCSAVTD